MTSRCPTTSTVTSEATSTPGTSRRTTASSPSRTTSAAGTYQADSAARLGVANRRSRADGSVQPNGANGARGPQKVSAALMVVLLDEGGPALRASDCSNMSGPDSISGPVENLGGPGHWLP